MLLYLRDCSEEFLPSRKDVRFGRQQVQDACAGLEAALQAVLGGCVTITDEGPLGPQEGHAEQSPSCSWGRGLFIKERSVRSVCLPEEK